MVFVIRVSTTARIPTGTNTKRKITILSYASFAAFIVAFDSSRVDTLERDAKARGVIQTVARIKATLLLVI